ncbi:hypothetical protein PMI40_03357 [Herbaspirillum sp. YR522]|nr:hypothetical protein PMI40_03357 [Herbaspirillum sp. YR522]
MIGFGAGCAFMAMLSTGRAPVAALWHGSARPLLVLLRLYAFHRRGGKPRGTSLRHALRALSACLPRRRWLATGRA